MTKVRWARSLVLLTGALALDGCSTMKGTWNGWFGEKENASVSEPESESAAHEQVFYSAVEGLTVYGRPSSSSKVLGRLALHEKVTRTRIEHGYAFIRTAEGGLEGWVDNAQLDWRKPATAPAAKEAAPAREAPAEGEAPAEEKEEDGGAKAAESPTPTPTEAEEAPQTPVSPPASASPPADAAPPAAPTPRPRAEPKMFDPY